MQDDEFWHKRCLIIFIDTQRVGRYQEIVGCKGIIKTNTLRTKREPEIHTQSRGQSKKEARPTLGRWDILGISRYLCGSK